MEHAAGACDEAVSLVIACHATLCPRCRDVIAELESIGGALLGNVAPAPAAPEVLASHVLNRVGPTTGIPDPPRDGGPFRLPQPLLRYTGPWDRLEWERVLPGVSAVTLPLKFGDVPVRLKRVGPGLGVPPHGHAGLELDLVLSGGLHDTTREIRYERGDLQFSDPSVEHTLRILDGEDCIVLSACDARMRPRGLRSRVLHLLMGW